MQKCLVIEEVEHVFNGQRKHRAAMSRAEDSLEQIIHVLLQGAL
jgi:hypothetical protein